ncbi:DinB family protein [Pullulanibacillus sp. KACC 23026]|uniref:DinB family protein n=1 Tax=Pullulanibacillus sp. KACC 23026 TaxID=3028315 RepID=UPI0023B1BAF4|nr:DinB family protein [Pullulanibacillus sp. KACC 23026]WEG14396.1 DinB family protein [Pullulanibacillus sp. KACC 23026]
MNFKWEEALEVLERTPHALNGLLAGLSDGWLFGNEGDGTWSPYEVIGHLIEAEKTNWWPRLDTILSTDENKAFPPFDRFAHLTKGQEQTIEQKLNDFKQIRSQSVRRLKSLIDPEKHFELTGEHPEFGSVQLRELLATWVVHDLTHISQIVRVMAKRYNDDVGPWKSYLGILNR